MKRHDNLFEKIIDLNNLRLADKKARRGKSKYRTIKQHDKFREENIVNIHYLLKNNQYKVSPYSIFELQEYKKVRTIYRLPYLDRIIQHAIANIIEPLITPTFTSNTYSSIKKRGIHLALKKLSEVVKFKSSKYYLKFDIEKYYPSVSNEILKKLIRKKFKDEKLLELLDKIIDSNVGLPIGSYLSQIFGNFYLSEFDHWLKEDIKVKHLFRYMDDIICISESKEYLKDLINKIKTYLKNNLNLKVKINYIIEEVKKGIDFVGYIIFPTHIRLRKRIKLNFIEAIKNNNESSIPSYYGWLIHGDCINLWNKYYKTNYYDNN